MRPDEHKKKRSAQYQRKHGGGGGKGAKGESDKSTSKSGKSGAAKGEKTSVPHLASRLPQQDKKVDLSLSPSGSEDEEQNATQRANFRRREITSNWAKYDIPPAEADNSLTTPKGQDFNKLLQGAGSATAHFRFKDEENWEDDPGSEGAAATQVLSLDCNKLADSLDCLPLYAQLRLDTDIFSPEQLEVMEKSANKHRALAGLPALNQQQEISSSQPDSKPSSDISVTPVSTTEQSETLKSSTSPKDRKITSAIDAKNDTPKNVQKGYTETKTVTEKEQGASVGFSDADLDRLLETDNTEERDCGVERSVQPGKVTSGEMTEKDLDDLLAADAPKSNGPGLSSNSGQKETKANAESEDLEDWLDSVLDS